MASTDLLQKLYLVLAQASDSKRTWLWRRCSPCCTRPLCRCTPSATKSTALWKCRTEPYLLRVIKTRSRETDRIFPEHVGSALNMFDRILTKAQEKGMKSCPPPLSSFEFVCLSSTFTFPLLSLSSTCRYWTRSPPTPQPRAVVIPELNSEILFYSHIIEKLKRSIIVEQSWSQVWQRVECNIRIGNIQNSSHHRRCSSSSQHQPPILKG